MKALQIMTFLLLGAIVLSCGSKEKTGEEGGQSPQEKEQHQFYNQMMAVHDEVMPRMGELVRLTQGLEDKLKALPNADAVQRNNIEQTIEALQYADGGMMMWMREVQPLDQLRQSMSHEEIMTYIQQEQVKVEKVKENILTSLDAAKQLLESLN